MSSHKVKSYHMLLVTFSFLLSSGCIKKTKTKGKVLSTVEEVQSYCSTPHVKNQLSSTNEKDKSQILESLQYYESQARLIYYKLLLDRFFSTIESEKNEPFGESGLTKKWTTVFAEKMPQCLSLINTCSDENWKPKNDQLSADKSVMLTASLGANWMVTLLTSSYHKWFIGSLGEK